MKVILPFRGEFGMKVWWHVPAVHAIEGPKVVYVERGEQALYPSARGHVEVQRKEDNERRNHYHRDQDFVDQVEEQARERFGPDAEYLRPDQKWPRKRFVPEPVTHADVRCDVVVCPRRRNYGAEKNWPEWYELTERLVAEGVRVFAGGVADSSYQVPCKRAWEYDRPLDATIEAMHQAKVVVATCAGLAHLAVLCGRPLLLITYGKGLVAPGPVIDEKGRHMEDRYWPVKMERYEQGNHTGSEITLLEGAWYDPVKVLRETLERVR